MGGHGRSWGGMGGSRGGMGGHGGLGVGIGGRGCPWEGDVGSWGGIGGHGGGMWRWGPYDEDPYMVLIPGGRGIALPPTPMNATPPF